MSEQDVDLLVGRLVRQKTEDLKRKAAIEAELKQISSAVSRVVSHAHEPLNSDQRRAEIASVEKYLNADALLGLVDERDATQKRIFEAIGQLRDMGYGNL